ncbi:MAG: hypothetical protein PHQ63_04915 [Smithellaceae bacterium]|nr:hypothetical protein [Smithellaceae bacterium]
MENIQQTMIEEAAQALLNSPPQSAQEIFEGFQRWKSDLKAWALKNLDELIQRDQGTARETMWRTLRADYAQFIQDQDPKEGVRE